MGSYASLSACLSSGLDQQSEEVIHISDRFAYTDDNDLYMKELLLIMREGVGVCRQRAGYRCDRVCSLPTLSCIFLVYLAVFDLL